MIMNKYNWIGIIIVLLSQTVFATPTLLWKKTLQSSIISVSQSAKRNLTSSHPIFPIGMIHTKKNVYMFDTNAKEIQKISLEMDDLTTISDNGQMMARLINQHIIISKMNQNMMLDIPLNTLHSVVLPQHLIFSLSPDGQTFVLISWFAKTIHIYHSGQLTASYQEHELDLRGSQISFSKDSSHAVIHIPNWGAGKGQVIYYNRYGNKAWQFEYHGNKADVDMSSDASTILVLTSDHYFLLDHTGQVQYDKQLDSSETAADLSGDGQTFVQFNPSNCQLTCMNLSTGTTLWSNQIQPVHDQLCELGSLHVSETGTYNFISMLKDWTQKNNQSTLYVFDRFGKLIWEHAFQLNYLNILSSTDESWFVGTGGNQACLYYMNK